MRVYYTETRTCKKRYYARALRGGKAYELGDAIAKLALRGGFVSWIENHRDTAGSWFVLTVIDVPRDYTVEITDPLRGTPQTLVATSRGEGAVLGATSEGNAAYVVKLDALGVSEIDRGAEVRDLALRGRTLHWLNGTQERTAPIRHVLRCGPERGVHSVELAPRIRVYVDDAYNPYGDEEFEDWYACKRPGGKPFRMARIDPSLYSGTSADISERIEDLTFAHDFLAYAREWCGFGECESTVNVFDVPARRLLRRTKRMPGSVEMLVARRTGSVGALLQDHWPEEVAYVIKLDSSGQTELDRGPDVHDLTLDGSTLRWFNGAEPRSAELN